MCRIDRVRLERRSVAEHREPTNGQRLLDDGAAAQRAGDHTACTVATGYDLTANRAAVARLADHRQRDSIVVAVDTGDLHPETDVAALGDQRVAKTGDEFVLRVHVVRTVTGDGPVVEDDALVRRAELAAVVRLVERQDAIGDADGLQRLDGPVVDRAGLGHAAHVGLGVTLEHDEVDAGGLQHVGDHEAGGAGSDDRDRDIVSSG